METKAESFVAHVNQCRMDLGMAFMTELCQRLRNWLLRKEKFRVTIDYDPDGDAKVEIKPLINHNLTKNQAHQ